MLYCICLHLLFFCSYGTLFYYFRNTTFSIVRMLDPELYINRPAFLYFDVLISACMLKKFASELTMTKYVLPEDEISLFPKCYVLRDAHLHFWYITPFVSK